MTQRARITFVEQYYYPEGWGGAQIPRDITIDLVRAGHQVRVMCGSELYAPVQSEAAKDPRQMGVSISRVPPFLLFGRKQSKILGQVWFCIFATLKIIFSRWPTLFIVQTNPPLGVVSTSLLAAIMRRPLIVIAQDLYPEVMIAHGMLTKGTLIERLVSLPFRWAYRRAAYVVSLGPNMSTRLTAKGVSAERIHQISNWATGDLGLVRGADNLLAAEWGVMGKFVLLYSGNLGVAHDIDTVLRSIAVAKSSLTELRLIIVGQGGRIAEAKRTAAKLGLEEFVIFKPFVSSSLLPHTLGLADLALVTLLPGFEGLVVPSKVLGHMARGVATLYVGPKSSDVADLLLESGGGVSVENGEIGGLAATLIACATDRPGLNRMSVAARNYYIAHLEQEIGLSHYRDLIASVARKKAS